MHDSCKRHWEPQSHLNLNGRTQPLDYNLATCFPRKKINIFFHPPSSAVFIYPLTRLSSSAKLISFIFLAFLDREAKPPFHTQYGWRTQPRQNLVMIKASVEILLSTLTRMSWTNCQIQHPPPLLMINLRQYYFKSKFNFSIYFSLTPALSWFWEGMHYCIFM